MVEKPKVLFLASEVVPFAKTGGLGDVAGALPGALKRLGIDVRLVLPFYRVVREGNFDVSGAIDALEVPLGGEKLIATVLETETDDGAPVYLIDREDMYDRPNLYGNARGDYYDNLERFTFFSQAALKITGALPFKPDVIHCHDWQTGLVPALLKGPYSDDPRLSGTPTVFTIHNIGYQGIFSGEKLSVTGLRGPDFYHPEGLEYWGKMSLLKAGIVYSEAITTVSPRYGEEIQTAEYGMGMEGILRQRRAFLKGILNGVDYQLWDPARDSHLAAKYSSRRMTGKVRCKESLIREAGLDPSLQDRPLLGMISRLDAQKGFDLFVKILDDILALDVGVVVLGSGERRIQEGLEKAAERHPGRLGLFIGFNEPLAHRIMAGVDIFLIPSRYEPCGLTQMYALKYGTLPIVRATGGLDDTIIPFDPETGTGNGVKFGPYDSVAFLEAIRQGIALFEDRKVRRRVVANGMKTDFSWERSAESYLNLYRSLKKRPARVRDKGKGSRPGRVKSKK